MVHKIQVSFTDTQWEIISKLKGAMGNTDAEVIRNITIAWLAQQSLIADSVKKKDNRGK
jgi:hypothetical protein